MKNHLIKGLVNTMRNKKDKRKKLVKLLDSMRENCFEIIQ